MTATLQLPVPRSPSTGSAHIDAASAFIADTVDFNAQQLLTYATRAVVELLGERGSCLLLEGQPRVVVSTYAPGVCGWAVDIAKYPEIRAAIERRTVIMIEDAHADPLLADVEALLPANLKSIAVVPLTIRDHCVGVVLAQSSQARHVEPDALALASLLGTLTARLLPSDAAARDRELFEGPAEEEVVDVETKRCVLIIDDDDDNASIVGVMLARKGFDTLRANDGESGVALARQRRPDLILLDVNMGELDGYGAAQLLSADLLTRDIPIVFVSGAKDLMPRVRDLHIAGVDFLAKPFNRQELLTRIECSLTQAAAQKRARAEAHIDELTGLGNLRSLRERLAVEQARYQRHQTPVAIITVDVDKLKRINDTLGHAAGSLALSAIADVLRNDVRETDLAARYGGDEFVVLLPHANAEDGVRFAQRVLEHVRALRCNGASLSVSIGVAALEGEELTLETVLQRSDAAAYRAKRLGGGAVCSYESSDQLAVSAGG